MKESMTDPFEELIEQLRRLHQTYPDWRIGQLVTNVAVWCKGPTASGVWDIENSEFVEMIRRHLSRKG
jgi:hypothetical protein